MHDLSLGRRAQHVKAQIEDAIAYVRKAPDEQQMAPPPQPPPMTQGQPATPPMPQTPQQPAGGLQSLQKPPQSFAKGGFVRSVHSR